MTNTHMSKKLCTFCFKMAMIGVDDNICTKCDRELIAQTKKLQESQKTKRECRTCGRRLHASRYYHCDLCLPAMDSDDGDYIFFDYFDAEVKKPTVRLVIDFKICHQCRHRKPIESFARYQKSKDGHCNECKSCRQSNYQKKRAQAKAAEVRINELSEVQ
jgi:hypothetical protein